MASLSLLCFSQGRERTVPAHFRLEPVFPVITCKISGTLRSLRAPSDSSSSLASPLDRPVSCRPEGLGSGPLAVPAGGLVAVAVDPAVLPPVRIRAPVRAQDTELAAARCLPFRGQHLHLLAALGRACPSPTAIR